MKGVFLFWLLQYLLGIAKLTFSSTGMENKFSALARNEHLFFLLKENVRVLVAYGLLLIVSLVVLYPIVSWLSRRVRRVALFAFLLTFLVHILFLLKLAHEKPYFMQDIIGGWYWRQIASWIPSVFHTHLILILCILSFISWFIISQKRGRIILILLGAAALFFIPKNYVAGSHMVRERAQKNVIIIGSDSLRGDRVGYAGYQKNVSPVMDRLAASSQVFLHNFTPIASTLESNTSWNSSSYPHTHGLRQMYPSNATLAEAEKIITPIAQVLRDKNYETAAIGDWCAGFYHIMPMGYENIFASTFDNFKIYMSQAVMMAHTVVPLYFDHALGYQFFPELTSFAQFVTPEVVTNLVEKKLEENALTERPFFYHVFYSCNHLPYRSNLPYCTEFSDPSYKGVHRDAVQFDIDAFIGGTDLENKWKSMTPADMQQINALYDGCTKMFDDNVEKILQKIKALGMEKNTIVVILSDHGDDLYEPGTTMGHGLGFHGGDQTNHTPLIIHVPNKNAHTFSQLTNTLDLSPTLLDLLEIPKPKSWEGKSLAPWMDHHENAKSHAFYGETGFPFIQFKVDGITRPPLPAMDELTYIDAKQDYRFIMKDEYQTRVIAAKQRTLRTEKWKLILTPSAEGTHYVQLYNLTNDPHCEKNISSQQPEITERMQKVLEKWMAEKIETPIDEIFPNGE